MKIKPKSRIPHKAYFFGLAYLAAVVLCLLGWPDGKANAANSQGIVISPAIKNVVLAETDSEATFEFTLTNKGPEAQQVRLSALDFGSLDESGGVAFIGRSKDNPRETRYGLRQWIAFSADTVTLEPDEKQKVTAIITNRADLSPGGHYGAIIITPSDPFDDEGNLRVEIVPSSSILVFLKKTGGEQYGLTLDSNSFKPGLFDLGGSGELRFQNTGNVHVVPRGIVNVTTSSGAEVTKGIINPESGIILPQTFRKYPVTTNRLKRLILPGTYTFHIAYRYDGSDAFQYHSQDFVYIGSLWYLIGGGLTVLAGSGFAIALFKRQRKRRRAKKAGQAKIASKTAEEESNKSASTKA